MLSEGKQEKNEDLRKLSIFPSPGYKTRKCPNQAKLASPIGLFCYSLWVC